MVQLHHQAKQALGLTRKVNNMRKLHRRSLVSQIMLILLLFNIVAVVVFTFYIYGQDRQSTVQNIEYSLQANASEKAETISLAVRQVAKETESLSSFAVEKIKSEKSTTLSTTYIRSSSGYLYRDVNNKAMQKISSSLFFPAKEPITNTVAKQIVATEKLDSYMKSIPYRNPYIQWVYIATEEGMLRTFPYSSVDVFDATHMQRNDPFYTIANPKNDPTRKTVWTSPYLDYLGTGWMVTCSTPIYVNNKFVGVACSDVRLDTIKNEFLKDFRLGKGGIVCLLESSGNIIYHPSISPVGDTSGQTFLKNILTDANQSKQYVAAMKKILNGYKGVVSYRDEQQRSHLISYANVDLQPWIVAVDIVQSQYLQISNLNTTDLWKFCVILLTVYALIALLIYKQYSKPFGELVKRAHLVSEGNFQYQEPISNFFEIEALSDAFNYMSNRVKDYTTNLLQKNKEIQSIMNGIGGTMMLVSPQMDIIEINEQTVQALGKPKNQLVGLKCYNVFAGRNKICKGCHVQEAIECKERTYAKVPLKNDIFQNTYYPLFSSKDEIYAIIVHSQRITKSILIEKELSQKEKMSEIGQLSAAIAHELKNPLAIIKGSTYLLSTYEKGNPSPEVQDSIETIIQTTENAEKVIYNLLDFSSPKSIKHAPENICRLIEQIILITNRTSIKSNVVINTSFATEPLLFIGNVEPLKHIIMNLISNAINAMPNGGSVWITCGSSDDGSLQISVKDNGPGVPQQLQQSIFEPFYTTDQTGKGSGMGLWIAKILIEKMGGTIQLISTPQNGSEFIINVPNQTKDMEK